MTATWIFFSHFYYILLYTDLQSWSLHNLCIYEIERQNYYWRGKLHLVCFPYMWNTTKASPGASRVHGGLLWVGVSVRVNVSDKHSPLNCTSCSLFTGKTPTKVSRTGIKSYVCNYKVVAVLRTGCSSPFGTVEQWQILSDRTDVCSLADGAYGYALLEEILSMMPCVLQCKQARNQLWEIANHLHFLTYIQALFPEGIILSPRLHVCTSKYDTNKKLILY